MFAAESYTDVLGAFGVYGVYATTKLGPEVDEHDKVSVDRSLVTTLGCVEKTAYYLESVNANCVVC